MNAPASTSPHASLDLNRIRAEFPILAERIRKKELVYLDNAASTQKPLAVMAAMDHCYSHQYANVHRGVHTLSQRATDTYENARETVRAFLNARETAEVIFTRGTTEAINLVAQSFGGSQVRAGDEVLISAMEHHSNIVPWQMLCDRVGARLRVIPMSDAGELMLDEFEDFLTPVTRILAITQVSNALGTVNPVAEMIGLAHAHGIPVLVDAAQAVAHLPVDVRALDCDFYAFSGHKIYGPTGVGVLYGKRELLEAMPPWQGGGDMIRTVSFAGSTWNELPYKFEAGTPAIAEVIGLGAALRWLNQWDRQAIFRHEEALMTYATERMAAIKGLNLVGTAKQRAGAISFTLDGIHPHDIGTVLDMDGIAIRAGHHCAMPVMERLGLAATARASFGIYNTVAEVDRLLAAIPRVQELFS
jgi:cysteine desulfurase / selenocysteine lyase